MTTPTPDESTAEQVAAAYIACRFPDRDESDGSRPRQSRARLVAADYLARRFPTTRDDR